MDPPHRFTLADLETVAMNGQSTIFCPRDERQQPLSLVTLAPDVAIAIIGDSEVTISSLLIDDSFNLQLLNSGHQTS